MKQTILATPKKQTIHIDTRTIEQISIENKELQDKLKENIKCLNMKRHQMMENKHKEKFQDMLHKKRKQFAFRINLDPPITAENQVRIMDLILKLAKDTKTEISRHFIMQNFLYFVTKDKIILALDKINLPTGHIMEQINPKDILNNK